MIKNEYLQAVSNNLDNYSYRQRFLEELSDHYDDESYNLAVSGKKNADEATQNNMGEPTLLAENFNKNMEKIYKMHWIRNVIITAVAAALVYALSSFLGNIISNTFIKSDNSYLIDFIYAIISTILMILYYLFGMSNIRSPKLSKKRKIVIILLLLFFPLLISLFSLFFLFFDSIIAYVSQNENTGDINWQQIILPNLISFSKNIFITVLGWFVINRSLAKPAILHAKASNIFNILKICIYLMIIGIILFPIIFPINASATNNIFQFIFMLNFIIMILSGIIISNIFNVLITQYFVISIYLIAIIFTVWHIIRYLQFKIQKDALQKFPWMALILLIYSFTSLVVLPLQKNTSSEEFQSIKWQVPAVYISEKIEKKQFGPFYNFIHYFNQDEGQAFHYSINQNLSKNEFIINQNSGKQFIISNINSLNNYSQLIEKNKNNKKMAWISAVTGFNNPDVKCVYPENYDAPLSDADWSRSCAELYYKNKLIYKSEGWPEINNFLVSQDGKWALLHFNNGAYNPSDVYLVQLP